MREQRITLSRFAFLAGTRGMIGFGLGLLLADRVSHRRRRALGVALLVAGALAVIPSFVVRRAVPAPAAAPHQPELPDTAAAAMVAD